MSHCDSSECIGSGVCFVLAMEAQCTSLVVECLDLISVCAFSVVFGALIFIGWVFDLVVASLALVVLVLCFLLVTQEHKINSITTSTTKRHSSSTSKRWKSKCDNTTTAAL